MTITLFIAVLIGLFLAYANGANDNFKGVATLFGSGTTDYKKALLWATISTGLGSLTALVLARGLIASFSGKGLVPDSVAALPSFTLAVGLAAAATVMLATKFGFPISTTHSLVGGLIGAGFMASSTGLHLDQLFSFFFLPLLVSPFIAITGAYLLYSVLRLAGSALGIRRETCLCVGTEVLGVVPQGTTPQQALTALATYPGVSTGTTAQCVERYQGRFLGISVGSLLDRLHFLSAGAMSFARGLNDTPKIAAILLMGSLLDPAFSIVGVGALMAAGGLISARKVAHTMSLKITDMNHAQGLTANLITSTLLIFASRLGMPVSTTHISCGSLFGLGSATGQAKWKPIAGIVTSWVVTLPVAALFGFFFFLIFKEVMG